MKPSDQRISVDSGNLVPTSVNNGSRYFYQAVDSVDVEEVEGLNVGAPHIPAAVDIAPDSGAEDATESGSHGGSRGRLREVLDVVASGGASLMVRDESD